LNIEFKKAINKKFKTQSTFLFVVSRALFYPLSLLDGLLPFPACNAWPCLKTRVDRGFSTIYWNWNFFKLKEAYEKKQRLWMP